MGNLTEDAFIHSDQGFHYTNPQFQKLVKKMGLGQSMSRRGNCWDNAQQESFFAHFKDETNSDSMSPWIPLSFANSSYCQVCSGLSPPSCCACWAHTKIERL